MTSAGGSGLELYLQTIVIVADLVDQVDAVGIRVGLKPDAIELLHGAGLILVVDAPAIVLKAPVYSGPYSVELFIDHIHGGRHHLHALVGSAADRDVDDLIQDAAGAVQYLDRPQGLLMGAGKLVVVHVVPGSSTQLAADQPAARVVPIAVVAPRIGRLLHRDNGEVIAMADDTVYIVDLHAGDLYSVLLALKVGGVVHGTGAALHPDQMVHIGGHRRIGIQGIRRGQQPGTQLAVSIGAHSPHGAVGQQNSRGPHCGCHIHYAVQLGIAAGEAPHGSGNVLIGYAVLSIILGRSLSQLTIGVVAPGVSYTCLRYRQHMVGSGGNGHKSLCNGLVILILDHDLYRQIAVLYEHGIKAQLAVGVVAPAIDLALLIQRDDKAVTRGNAHDVLKGIELQLLMARLALPIVGGSRAVVGQRDGSGDQLLSRSSTQLTGSFGLQSTVGVHGLGIRAVGVITPGPHGAVLLQSKGVEFTQHQLRVGDAVSDDDSGKGGLSCQSILDHSLGLTLPDRLDFCRTRVIRVTGGRRNGGIQGLPLELVVDKASVAIHHHQMIVDSQSQGLGNIGPAGVQLDQTLGLIKVRLRGARHHRRTGRHVTALTQLAPVVAAPGVHKAAVGVGQNMLAAGIRVGYRRQADDVLQITVAGAAGVDRLGRTLNLALGFVPVAQDGGVGVGVDAPGIHMAVLGDHRTVVVSGVDRGHVHGHALIGQDLLQHPVGNKGGLILQLIGQLPQQGDDLLSGVGRRTAPHHILQLLDLEIDRLQIAVRCLQRRDLGAIRQSCQALLNDLLCIFSGKLGVIFPENFLLQCLRFGGRLLPAQQDLLRRITTKGTIISVLGVGHQSFNSLIGRLRAVIVPLGRSQGALGRQVIRIGIIGVQRLLSIGHGGGRGDLVSLGRSLGRVGDVPIQLGLRQIRLRLGFSGLCRSQFVRRGRVYDILLGLGQRSLGRSLGNVSCILGLLGRGLRIVGRGQTVIGFIQVCHQGIPEVLIELEVALFHSQLFCRLVHLCPGRLLLSLGGLVSVKGRIGAAGIQQILIVLLGGHILRLVQITGDRRQHRVTKGVLILSDAAFQLNHCVVVFPLGL